MLPEIPHHKLVSLMRILDANRNGFMEREEFELLMLEDKDDLQDIHRSDSAAESVQNNSAISEALSMSRKSVKSNQGDATVQVEDGPMIARSLAMKF